MNTDEKITEFKHRVRTFRRSLHPKIGYARDLYQAKDMNDLESKVPHLYTDFRRSIGGKNWGTEYHLPLFHVQKMYDAVKFANCKGLVLNTFFTCTWMSLFVQTDNEVELAISKQMDLLWRWGKAKGFDLHHVWVVERGSEYGLHYHVLLYTPEKLLPELEHEAEQSLLTITGIRPGVFYEDPDYPSHTVPLDVRKIRGVSEQWYAWRYMMKGMEECKFDKVNGEIEPIQLYLGLERFRYQGKYTGKRCGISKSLNTAKKAAFEKRFRKTLPDTFNVAEVPSDLYGDQFMTWSQKYMIEPERVKLMRSLDV